jgi:signal transduction histidine kinase
MRRATEVAAGVAVLGAGVTVARYFDPDLMAVSSQSSSGVLEASAAMAALLLACLAYGRWRQRGLLADLWVCYGITVIAAGKLLFVVLPVLAGVDTKATDLQAAALIAGTAGALFLLFAASVSFATTAPARRPLFDLTALLSAVVFISVGVGLLGDATGGWFTGLSDFLSTEATGDRGAVAISVLQLATAAVFAVTAALLVKRRLPDGDTFFAWMAVASVLWSLARINYALTPARLASYVTVGDWLRLTAYAVLIVGAVRELRAYWAKLADVAVLEERRRMARELHDGVAQELAFIVTQANVLVRQQPGEQRPKLLRSAAERALDESRRAIAALTRPTDEPLAATIGQAAEEVGGRLGARVHLELEEHIKLDGEARENLVRITREAVTNAVRHGGAATVTVRLSNHDGVTLEVLDSGTGFDVDDLDHLSGRLGLASMHERAERAGGTLQVTSRRYGGTSVRVRLP